MMDVKEPLSPPSSVESKSSKLFFLGEGHHSRNSSLTSLMGDEAEASVELLKQPKLDKEAESYSKEKESCRRRCNLSGSCMCKLSVVVYLVTCILISALYVVFFGKNQAIFGDAWIPGKPTVHDKPVSYSNHYFEDLPYTEWLSQRWTYQDARFADWPAFPEEIDRIRQVVPGNMGRESGVWLLTDSQLFFAQGLYGSSPEGSKFWNVSQELDVEVTGDSYIMSRLETHLYLFSTFNVTLLDCTQQECEVASVSCGDVPLFDAVLSSCHSLTDDSLWVGSSQGLFRLIHESEEGEGEGLGCISFTNISEVVGPVQTLAWRSEVTDHVMSRHPQRRPFFMRNGARNTVQDVYASSNHHGSQWTASWRGQKEVPRFGVLVVGTAEKLYLHDGQQWWYEWVAMSDVGGIIDGPPTALTFAPSGELYIASNGSLTRLNMNYTFERIGPVQGLPYHQLTSLHLSSLAPCSPPLVGPSPPSSLAGTLWIGTAKGYTLFDVKSSKFVGYYNGPRWLPGGSVLSVIGSRSHVLILTEEGVAVVSSQLWTLNSKARHYQAMLERHTRFPGLVSDCPLTNHTPSTCAPVSTDSDGLWTSWMVAAEVFRYHVTKDPAAQQSAWTLFSGLKFLVNVTDIPGFMARSVLPENTTNSTGTGEGWLDSASCPDWRWRGGGSADELLGHMWVYPLIYDMATDEQQQRLVHDLLYEVVDYIRSNGYFLVDLANSTTHAGVWAPSRLNLNQSWAQERGVNSLQILSYLLSAYRVTKDYQFLQDFKELFSGHYEDVPALYGMNLINLKLPFPPDGAHSDEQLSFLPYFLYYYSLKRMDRDQLEQLGSGVRQFADLSIQRTWRTVHTTRSSAWTTIFAYATGAIHDKGLLEQLVWNLRTWPLELIEWQTQNSHRTDIRPHPELARGDVGMTVLPANERTQLRWDTNPFLLDSAGRDGEMDPGAWLLPYWMARWSGMLS